MRNLYIGIDPGASGAIAWLEDGLRNPGFFKNDGTERDVWNALNDLIDFKNYDVFRGAIEQVNAMPGQGVSSTFKFGQSFGLLRGFLIASGVPFEMLRPTEWQKAMGLSGKFPSKTARKNAHKARAQELFPELKITHANADALLIAAALERKYA